MISGFETTLMVRVSVSNKEFISVTLWTTWKVPFTVGVPEISPVLGLMLRPDGIPVALHAPIAGMTPVPAVAVEGNAAGSPR